MPRGRSDPLTCMAVCTVCLFRRIKKQNYSEVIRIAIKNKWSYHIDKQQTTEFICPDCKKEGYDFE